MYFDRFDICEAFWCCEVDFNQNGWLHERKSNRRRRESTGVQLHRMDFKPALNLSFETLTENGKEIYMNQVEKLKLPA